jgi:hypothetical protein
MFEHDIQEETFHKVREYLNILQHQVDLSERIVNALLDFARIWQAAAKIVYSKSLETVSTPKTRLEREFDPQVVRDLKPQLPHDVSVGGPALAAQAIRAGLVDEVSSARRAYYAWRRQAGPAQQRMREAGSPGRAPFWQWNGLSSLSHAGLMEAVAPGSERFSRSERKR